MHFLLALVLVQDTQAFTPAEDALPKDVVSYIGLTGLEKAPGAVLSVLTTYAGEGEGAKLFAEIATLIEKAIDELPEPLRKDAPKAIRSIRELHLAFTQIGEGGLRGAALLRADGEMLKKLFEEQLKAMFPEAAAERGRTLYIAPQGPFGDTPVVFSVAGPWLAIATSREEAHALLDRLAKPDKANALASHPLLAKLGPAKADRVELRHFMDGARFWSALVRDRRTRIDFDRVDGALDFRKLAHEILRAWVEDGVVRTSHEVGVAPGCTIFDLVRMKPGELSTLAFASTDAAGTVALRLDDAKGWRDRLKDVVTTIDESMTRHPDFPRKAAWPELEEELGDMLGVNSSELAEAVGPEAAWILDFDDVEEFGRRGAGMVFVMKMTDAAKVKKIFDAVERIPWLKEWKSREHGGVTIRVADERPEISYAFVGDYALLATAAAAMDRAIDAQAKKDGLLTGDFVKKLRATLPAEASKFAAVNVRRVAEAIEKESHTGTEYHARLRKDAWEIAVARETDNAVIVESAGAGSALVATPSFFFPIMLFQVRAYRVMGFPGGEIAPLAPLDLPEAAQDYVPPADPKADVDAFIRQLGSDDADVREAATRKLVRIGKPCIDAVAKAGKGTDDPEVKARAEGILLALEAYDVLPNVVDRRIDDILSRYTATDEWQRFSQWEIGYVSDWNIEPNFKTYTVPSSDHALLGSAGAVKALLRTATDTSAPLAKRDAAVGMLALVDAGSAGDALVEGREKESDAKLKLIWTIAAGWAPGEKGRAVVLESLGSSDVWTRRAAFLAAERRTDPETVDKLLELLDATDAETRWNAGVTLGRLTGEAIAVNGFASESDRKAAADKARAWWKDHRATHKPAKPQPLRD